MVGPMITPIPKMAWTIPSCAGGKISMIVACAVAISAAPPMP